MASRSLHLISTLLELHSVNEPEALLPLLLRRMAKEHGRALAAAYLLDSQSGELVLELLAEPEGTADPHRWHHTLHVPLSLPHATALPVLMRLALADPITLTGPLATLLDGLWPTEIACEVERALGTRFAAVAPIRIGQGPVGLVLLVLQEGWPVNDAAECAAHAAAALGRLYERRTASRADTDPFARAVIDQVAAREISRASRYGRPLSIAVLERQTDTQAPAPQLALAALAARVMRQPDIAGHLDQQRLVVLLPETELAGAEAFLHRLLTAAGAGFPALRGGCAAFPADGRSLDELVQTALGRLHQLPLVTAEAVPFAHAGPTEGTTHGFSPAPVSAEAAKLANVRLRISPVTDAELAGWKTLLERLPAVVSVEPCGFDGFAGTFDLRAPSVTRLLVELQRLAAKIGADMLPTVTGEVGLTLRAPGARTRSRFSVPVPSGRAGGQIPPPGTRKPEPKLAAATPVPPRRRISWQVGAIAAALVFVPALIVAIKSLVGAGAETTGAPVVTITASAAAERAVEMYLTRDLTGNCLPLPGEAACDPLRAGLWAGDPEAWRQWTTLFGGPALTPAEVEARTTALRAGAGDPLTRARLARASGRALPVIAGLRVSAWEGQRRVIGLELANLGGVPADLSAVTIPGIVGRLPAGATLAAGQRCTIGAAAGDGGCPFAATIEPLEVAPGSRVRLVSADGQLLDEFLVP